MWATLTNFAHRVRAVNWTKASACYIIMCFFRALHQKILSIIRGLSSSGNGFQPFLRQVKLILIGHLPHTLHTFWWQWVALHFVLLAL